MKVKIKKLIESAIVPKKASEGAAAYDLYAPATTIVKRGRGIIKLGFSIEMQPGYEAKIEPRSGYSSKGFEDKFARRRDADVLVGKIDSDYRGEVGVIIRNNGSTFVIEKGQRIAQMTFYEVIGAEFDEVDELTETERGEGGFGSTGIF